MLPALRLLAIVAQSDHHHRGWGDHMTGWGGGWMWLWGTLMVLTWVAIIGAVVWFVARSLGSRPRSSARDILEERYARGEISTDEYRERLGNLR